MANRVGDARGSSESSRIEGRQKKQASPRLTLLQGYAISDSEMTLSRDEFQRKFGDPQTGHAE